MIEQRIEVDADGPGSSPGEGSSPDLVGRAAASPNRVSRRGFVQRVGGLGLAAASSRMLVGFDASVLQRRQPSRVPRIGFLSATLTGSSPVFGALRDGLHKLGYVDGRDVAIEYRSSEGDDDRLPGLAEELVADPVDVFVAEAWPAIEAARTATSTVPIVMASSSDPVDSGLVAALRRPGGNVTGVTLLSTGLAGKRLELLREIVPSLPQLTVVWAAVAKDKGPGVREATSAAQTLGLQVQTVEVPEIDALERTLEAVTAESTGALYILCDPYTLAYRRQIADIVAQSRRPAIYEMREFVQDGGLISYGPSLTMMARRAAAFVDKILRGAKPGDLPVEQPMLFDLVINLTAAHALGLTVPQHVLLQVTEVIR